jgi:homoserine O-acetyltransferase
MSNNINKGNSNSISGDLGVFKYPKIFKLESGKKLRNLEIAYQTFGKLNATKDNLGLPCTYSKCRCVGLVERFVRK